MIRLHILTPEGVTTVDAIDHQTAERLERQAESLGHVVVTLDEPRPVRYHDGSDYRPADVRWDDDF